MKVIIPVAGVGTRLRPLTYTQPKPLIPVAGKPIISFIIDQLVQSGVNDFVFIIGYLGEKIQEYIEKTYPNINKEFVKQEKRLGLGHAIWTAKEQVQTASEIFIVLGDTIYDTDMNVFLNNKNNCVGIKKVDNPTELGIARLNENREIIHMVEKPKIPKSNQALVGLYKIINIKEFLNALDYIIENNIQTNDEYQLTDALMTMLSNGVSFEPITINNWYDCGKKEILLETNTMLLKKEGFALTDLPAFDEAIIIHPVAIGKNCQIANSIVGPHVTIGDNTIIQHAVVTNSIIGNYAKIEDIVLNESVIGNDVSIKGSRQSLNIGDNTELDFSK